MKIRTLLFSLLILSFVFIGCGSTPKQPSVVEETDITQFNFVVDLTNEMDKPAEVYINYYSLTGNEPTKQNLLFEVNGKSSEVMKIDTTTMFAKGKPKSARFVAFTVVCDGKTYISDRYGKTTLDESYVSMVLKKGKLSRDKSNLICESEDADFIYEYVNNSSKDIYVGLGASDESYELAKYPMELLAAGDTMTFNINLDDLREFYEPEEFFINPKYSLSEDGDILSYGYNNLMNDTKMTVLFMDDKDDVKVSITIEDLE